MASESLRFEFGGLGFARLTAAIQLGFVASWGSGARFELGRARPRVFELSAPAGARGLTLLDGVGVLGELRPVPGPYGGDSELGRSIWIRDF